MVDAEAFRQILMNLLDNALKYGPPGQTLEIGLRTTKQRVQVWVADEGPGVPSEDVERVWHRYYRGKSNEQAAISGTGIACTWSSDWWRCMVAGRGSCSLENPVLVLSSSFP